MTQFKHSNSALTSDKNQKPKQNWQVIKQTNDLIFNAFVNPMPSVVASPNDKNKLEQITEYSKHINHTPNKQSALNFDPNNFFYIF